MDVELNKCVWMWAGLLTYRLCDRGYACDGCPVEQLFHPAARAVEVPRPAVVARVPVGASARQDRFHDAQHLWLRVLPAGRIQIGLDPVATRLLGASETVETVAAGTRLRRGDPAISVNLGGETIRFASPVAGEVLRAHRVRAGRIGSMLRHPYSRAWLLILGVPRLGKQLQSFLFGRNAGLRLAQDWSAIQQECLALASHSTPWAPILPDGGELDVARLGGLVGPAYPQLVRRWIGEERLRAGRLGTRAPGDGRAHEGGASDPPEGR